MKIAEIEAKSILVSTALPGADFVANPYIGCGFGCVYCYACFMGRFVNEQRSNWGNYVYAKTNAIDALQMDLRRLRRISPPPKLLMSSVTDPYQGPEKEYMITRGILRVLAEDGYTGPISILTKSPLVLRDLDILKNLHDVEVGITVTTTDDTISRWLEVRAPRSSVRLATLKNLAEAGVKTYAFVGPLLPHYRLQPEQLRKLFRALDDAGVREVFIEHINLQRSIRQRLDPVLEKVPAEVRSLYSNAGSSEHREVLNKLVQPLIAEYKLGLRLGEIIEHGK